MKCILALSHRRAHGSQPKKSCELASIGITTLEIMPVAEFSGSYNWGYDGVLQFAPSHSYGSPDDFRHFIDIAHQYKIAVLLDVVYNHLGKGASVFKCFSRCYFSQKYKNEWGEAINFDDEHSEAVRQYFLSNVSYWISEFHIDGLRIDATQQIFDCSEKNILSEIVTTAKNAAVNRTVFIIAENEPQDTSLLRDYNFDAVWSDDFHRSATVAMTSHAEAYYSDYSGTPQEFVSAAKYGYLFQGQYYIWQKKNRGTPTRDLSPDRFIHYLQNHDQIANSCRGLRLHHLCSFSLYKTFTALLILGPQTPFLFMGQEFCSSAPFYYFTDNHLQDPERSLRGRKSFLSQFQSIASVNGPLVPDPHHPDAFLRCKLNFQERITNQSRYNFHRDLLKLRRTDSVFNELNQAEIDGAVIGTEAFVLRYFTNKSVNDRLLVINYGKDLKLIPNPEPLLAPPLHCHWKLLWHSEDPSYEGDGIAPLNVKKIWNIRGQTAYFLGGEPD